MDASRARLVHGGDQQRRYLEAAHCPARAVCVDLRRIQGTRARFLHRARSSGQWRPHLRLEEVRRSPPAETSGTRPHGGAGQGAPGISYPLQKGDDPLFRRPRSRPLGTFFSVRARDEQRDHRLDPVLFFPALGLALFFFAAAIAWSRVYLGAHWPSDVLATFFLAMGETALLLALFEVLYRRAGALWAPDFLVRHPRLVGDAIS